MNKLALNTQGLLLLAGSLTTQKPIVQINFIADPAQMVYGDTVFLFTSHDGTKQSKTSYTGENYLR